MVTGRVMTEKHLNDELEVLENWVLSARTDEPATAIVAMSKLMGVMVQLGFNADLQHTLSPVEPQIEQLHGFLTKLAGEVLSLDLRTHIPDIKDGDPSIPDARVYMVQPFMPFEHIYEAEVYYQTQFERKIGEMYVGIEQNGVLVAVIAFDKFSRIGEKGLYFEGNCVFVRRDIQYLRYNRQGRIIPSTHSHLVADQRFGLIVHQGEPSMALVYPITE